MDFKENHKKIVENRGYEYIGSYKCGEVTVDGKCNKKSSYIRVKCLYCGAEYDIVFQSFKNGSNCTHCCNKYENSLAYFIEQILKESLNKYWDFEKNTVNPYHISKNYNGKIWIKCIKISYHDSYETICTNFVKGQRCPYCVGRKVHSKDSFAQYHIDHTDKDFIKKYWSNKNSIDPFSISPNSAKKVWIKCQEKEYHRDYLVKCDNFTRGNRCPYCHPFASHKVHQKDSFAQWCIDNVDKDFMNKYWSDKNKINPYDISSRSTTKIWIKCQETDYHGDYETTCNVFTANHRCPYCYNQKVHKLDSFGALYPEKAKYWSNRNKKSPYEVAPKSGKKYWFVCEDCGNEFKVTLHDLIGNNRSMKCLECTISKGERKIKEWLDKNNIDCIQQKEFNGLLGTGGGNLSYDFYLPNNNILIEFQGKQHEQFTKGFHRNIYGFKKQQEHDKRKKEYAINNNIDLLEIWYYDYDNIENILNKNILKF